eukprot:6209653-Pleurochrysis_carterae.AAC.3
MRHQPLQIPRDHGDPGAAGALLQQMQRAAFTEPLIHRRHLRGQRSEHSAESCCRRPRECASYHTPCTSVASTAFFLSFAGNLCVPSLCQAFLSSGISASAYLKPPAQSATLGCPGASEETSS